MSQVFSSGLDNKISWKELKVCERTGVCVAQNSLRVNGPFSLLTLHFLLRKFFTV